MAMPLLDSQKEAISKLHAYKVGALFMEAGTGKTRTAYELIKSIPDVDFVLWVAPYSAIHTDKWNESVPAEVEKCGGFLGMDSAFLGIESIQNSDRIYLSVISMLKKHKKPFIVCDESLKIKNYTAKRTKRMMEIGKLADYKLILNGTPLSRNLLDLWSQIEFLSPKILKMGIAEFKNTFCEYVKITKQQGSKSWSKEFVKEYHNLDYLYKLIEPYIFESELSLSVGKSYINIDYSVDTAKKELYEALKKKYLDNEVMEAMNNNIFLEITQKMQHEYCLSTQKFDIVDRLTKEVPEKTAIFCKFIASKEALKERYPQCRILSYGSNSLGLNLQKYNKIIYWDKTFDYAQRNQSERRIYRTGQTIDCTYYDLTGDVPLEGLFNSNIEKKGQLLERFKVLSNERLKEIL